MNAVGQSVDDMFVKRGQEQIKIEEEKQKWVIKVLSSLGLTNDLLKLKNEQIVDYMFSYGIELLEASNGEIDIYKNHKLIAKWKIPKLTLIKRNNEQYYEIIFNKNPDNC